MSADPSKLNINEYQPGSWNKYAYVGGDPVNLNDSSGLCDVVIGGITNGSGDSNQAVRDFTAGSIAVYPYAADADSSKAFGIFNGLIQVASQGFGSNSSTLTAVEGLAAAAEDGKPINVTTFSGGAAAFTAAVSWLNANGGSQIVGLINNITYVSPGALGSLYNNGSAIAVIGAGVVDTAATSATSFGGIPTSQVSACGHDFGCILSQSNLPASRSGDGCSDPRIIDQPNRRSFNRLLPGYFDPFSYPEGTYTSVTSTFHPQ